MSATFVLEKCALVSIDMAGFTRLVIRHDAVAIATMLERYYTAMAEIVERKGGRIVKFMGDGCLAVFPADRCVDAIDAAELALAYVPADPDGAERPGALRMGANVHVAQVACGEIGPAPHRRWDVFGAGVNHLFRMGGGSGLRISEPAYRQLPNDRRGAWRKDEPPAIYHFEP